jgi:hypothetical protein
LLGLEKESDPASMLNKLRSIEKQVDKIEESLRQVLNERGGLNLS